MSKEGEVEIKVKELTAQVFEQYNPGNANVNSEGKPYILKENLREFVQTIMGEAGQDEAWNEADFEKGYAQFDEDGSGQIEEAEFEGFIKKYADL